MFSSILRMERLGQEAYGKGEKGEPALAGIAIDCVENPNALVGRLHFDSGKLKTRDALAKAYARIFSTTFPR
jgi:hypothetical protein